MPDRPNVLLVFYDDLNDTVGPLAARTPEHRNRAAHTPNMDRLAANGVVFDRAYCAAPVCNASRCATLVGRHPFQTGVYGNGHPYCQFTDAVSLAEHFRANGYETRGFGKLFHDGSGESESAYTQDANETPLPDAFNTRPSAWDAFTPMPAVQKPFTIPAQGVLGHLDRPPEVIKESDGGAHNAERHGFALPATDDTAAQVFDWGDPGLAEADYPEHQLVQQAARFIERDHDKPFFLGLGLTHPHLPWYTPQRFFDMYPLDAIEPPDDDETSLDQVPALMRDRMQRQDARRGRASVIQAHNLQREAIRAYRANVTFADHLLGQVLDALERSPANENTIVVLISDHGWYLGEKMHWGKSTLWEPACRVPMIIRPAAGTQAAHCAAPVSLVDLYPTLIDLCDLPARPNLAGRSLTTHLNDPEAPTDSHAITTSRRNNHAIRTTRYRYIRYRNASEELYDMQADPHERQNLAEDPSMQTIKQQLADRLDHELTTHQTASP